MHSLTYAKTALMTSCDSPGFDSSNCSLTHSFSWKSRMNSTDIPLPFGMDFPSIVFGSEMMYSH